MDEEGQIWGSGWIRHPDLQLGYPLPGEVLFLRIDTKLYNPVRKQVRACMYSRRNRNEGRCCDKLLLSVSDMVWQAAAGGRPIAHRGCTHAHNRWTKFQEESALPTQEVVLVAKCTHTDQIKDVSASSVGCAQCLALGDTWVHLRMCLTCGQVGCCEDSKNKHALKHYQQDGHPIVRSHEPGETWLWCYPDQVFLRQPVG